MSFMRQLDTCRKLYACFATLLCASTAFALWMLGQLGQLSALTAKASQKLSAAGYIDSLRLWTWFFIGVSLLLGAALAAWLQGEVRRPAREAQAMARRMAQGDLSTGRDLDAAGAGDALLAAMQEMNDKLAGMIAKVRNGADSIARNAGAMAAGSMDLSARTGEQAAALEVTASAMEQLTTTILQNAAHARQATELALSACAAAVTGGETVAEVVGSMASIDDASRRIADITGVVDALAFQTNILAQNAATAAAGAGEQGRGFAVVAAEARNLAQRSAAAARQIKVLIDDSADKLGSGAGRADRVGATMRQVVAGVKRVTALVGEIAHLSAEQTAGVEQVKLAIADMDRATLRHAGLAARGAAAAAAMRDEAGSLSRATAAFALGKNYAMPVPALQLVASNPHRLVRIAPDGKARNKGAPLHAVVRNPPAPAAPATASAALPRSQGGALCHDLDWEEF